MVLPVFNEESRLEICLRYYSKFGKVIIIDNFSTDKTEVICQKYNVEIHKIENQGSTHTKEWHKKLFEIVKSDYILGLSCSEFIGEETLALFEEVASKRQFNLVITGIETYTCGEKLMLWERGGRVRKSGKLFNKQEIDINSIEIHELISTKMKNDVLDVSHIEKYNAKHIRDSSFYSLIYKHLGYAQIEALENRPVNLSLLELIKKIIYEVYRYSILPSDQKGFVAKREIIARIFLHISIYMIAIENKEKKGWSYSRDKSKKLWQDFQNNIG